MDVSRNEESHVSVTTSLFMALLISYFNNLIFKMNFVFFNWGSFHKGGELDPLGHLDVF